MRNIRLIKDMQVGETGYTLPWALYAYPSNYLFARGDYPVRPDAFGTMELGITRVDNASWQLTEPLPDGRTFDLAPLHVDWDWVQVKRCSEQEVI